MSKVNILKNLAKLRQFSKGGDPSAYLETEMRQNLRAIEEALKNGYAYDPSSSISNGSLALGIATADTTYSGSPTKTLLPLTETNASVVNGSLKNSVYFPSAAGRYMVDAHLAYVSGGGALSGQLWIYESDDTYVDVLLVNNSNYFEQSKSFFIDLSPTSGIYFKYTGTGMVAKFDCRIFKLS